MHFDGNMHSCAGQCCNVALFPVKVVLYLRDGGAKTPCMRYSDGEIYRCNMSINYEKLGDRIRTQRKKEGITQAQLAESLIMSESFINRIENGKQSAALETYVGIALKLNCTLNDLVQDSFPNRICLGNEISNEIMDCSADERDFLLRVIIAMKRDLRK